MPSILFVCTANQFRSPIAAACLLKKIQPEQGKWIIRSAGIWTKAGLPLPAFTLQAAHQLGIRGLYAHHTRPIEQEFLPEFDLIITMEAGQKEAICIEFPEVCSRVHLLSEIVECVSYDIPDPATSDLPPGQIAREIDMLITKGKERILELAESLCKSRLLQK